MAIPDRSRRLAKPLAVKGVAMLVATLAVFGALYAMARGPDNVRSGAGHGAPAEAGLAQALADSPAIANPETLSVGEMAKFVLKKAPEPLPEITFLDAEAKSRNLSEWRGRVVLLNVWATWCLPCRKEMPALERLQSALGSDKFDVVAVSADRGGVEAARKFFDQVKLTKLGLFADPSLRLTSTLKVVGLPATLLIDAEGREIGRLLGPAEWDSEEAKKLIGAAIR